MLETARKERAIGSPLEAAVVITPTSGADACADVLHRLGSRQLADVCLTSQASVGATAQEELAQSPFRFTSEADVEVVVNDAEVAQKVVIDVVAASGAKCVRCWQYTAARSDGDVSLADRLCPRCTAAIAASPALSGAV